MSDYLRNLINRIHPSPGGIRPRLAARFEPLGLGMPAAPESRPIAPTAPPQLGPQLLAHETGDKTPSTLAAQPAAVIPVAPALLSAATPSSLLPRPSQPKPLSTSGRAEQQLVTLVTRPAQSLRPAPQSTVVAQPAAPLSPTAWAAPAPAVPQATALTNPPVTDRAPPTWLQRSIGQPPLSPHRAPAAVAPLPSPVVSPVPEPPSTPHTPTKPSGLAASGVVPMALGAASASALLGVPVVDAAAEIRPKPAAPSPLQARAAPVIRVTIGRIDIRATVPPPRAQAPPAAASKRPQPALSLEDYLKQRGGTR
ncbi:MAG: hypothetical protein KF832_05085 [Caldilineaceae bacterium]|nr:hypothetical protein [Caldilineaceae bacterium]